MAACERRLLTSLAGRASHSVICHAGGRKYAIERSDTLCFLSRMRTDRTSAGKRKLDHSRRADTGRRKDIGGFLLGNFHKGLNHDGIELRAARLY